VTATTSEYDRLRAAYDSAFQELCARAKAWDTLVRSGADAEAVTRARVARDKAYAECRRRRDALVEFLLSADRATADSEGHHLRVQEVAYRLWEESGRSPANPEEFWFRAEELVHH
jgi:hypothetical protein